MGQKRFDLAPRGLPPHRAWVALVVKENEALDPGNVGFLSSIGVALQTDTVTELVKQFLGSLRTIAETRLRHMIFLSGSCVGISWHEPDINRKPGFAGCIQNLFLRDEEGPHRGAAV